MHEPTTVTKTVLDAPPTEATVSIEPELLGIVPRKTVLAGNTVLCRMALWNLLAGFVLVMFFFAGRDLATWDDLIERGEPVTATVYDKHERHGKSTSYYRDYEFNADGVHVSESESVSRDVYNAVQNGDTLPVTYLPGTQGKVWQQGVADAAAKSERFGAWVTAAVFGAVVICSGLWAHGANIAKHRRLLASGVAVPGRVVSHNITEYKGNKTYTITYEFRTVAANPAHRTTKVSVDKAQYERHALYNEPFTVVYAPDDSYTSLPYFRLTAARLLGA